MFIRALLTTRCSHTRRCTRRLLIKTLRRVGTNRFRSKRRTVHSQSPDRTSSANNTRTDPVRRRSRPSPFQGKLRVPRFSKGHWYLCPRHPRVGLLVPLVGTKFVFCVCFQTFRLCSPRSHSPSVRDRPSLTRRGTILLGRLLRLVQVPQRKSKGFERRTRQGREAQDKSWSSLVISARKPTGRPSSLTLARPPLVSSAVTSAVGGRREEVGGRSPTPGRFH